MGVGRYTRALFAIVVVASTITGAGVRSASADGITFAQVPVAQSQGPSEPGIKFDRGTGMMYAINVAAGTDVWLSTDQGKSWQKGATTQGGGGDSDLATDANGVVYVADLLDTTLNSTIPVSVSTDRGANFGAPVEVDPAATGIAWDRQWIAAEGDGRVVVSARGRNTYAAWVSNDGAKTFSGPHTITDDTFKGGPLTFVNGVLYTSYLTLAPDDSGLVVNYAKSSDGVTWTTGQIAKEVNTSPIFIQTGAHFPILKADNAGNLYEVFPRCDNILVGPSFNCVVEFSASTDGGATWSPAKTLSQPGHSAVFPWVVAQAPGKVDVAYYEADQAAGLPDPGPDLGTPVTTWNVVMQQSLDGGQTWSRTVAAPGFHTGSVCTGGVTCLGQTGLLNVPQPGDRRDLDFFELTVDEAGNALIIYPKDRPLDPTNPNDVLFSSVDLTVAAQNAGPTIFDPAAPPVPTPPPIGTANTCPAGPPVISDPSGDADVFGVASTPLGSDAQLDITSGDITWDGSAHDFTFTVGVNDLRGFTEPPVLSDGVIYDYDFDYHGGTYEITMNRTLVYVFGPFVATPDTAVEVFQLSDPDGNTTDLTGSFDESKEKSTATVPAAALDPAAGAGSVLSNLSITSRRDDGSVIAPVADTASGECSFVASAPAEPTSTALAYTGEVRGHGNQPVHLAAVLSDADGGAVAGKQIDFAIAGQTTTATTDATGLAEADVSVPGHGRSEQVDVTFQGDDQFEPAATSATIRWTGPPS